jgi:regulator of replication initiation timing
MEAKDSIDADLSALEQRVMQLALLVHRLRQENAALRDEKSQATLENAALRVKVDNATQRLQRLLERLPEETA